MTTIETAMSAAGGATIALVAAGIFGTPSEIGAIAAGIVGVVIAIGTTIVNIMTARANLRKTTEVAVLVTEVSAKTDTIGGHVNSAATKAAEEIAGLRRELQLAREDKAEKKEIAAVLAQSVSTANAPSPAAIEKNTVPSDVPVPDVKDYP